MPILVLGIGIEGSSAVKLVEIHDKPARYIALSHCVKIKSSIVFSYVSCLLRLLVSGVLGNSISFPKCLRRVHPTNYCPPHP
jgi:hypothetical protein